MKHLLVLATFNPLIFNPYILNFLVFQNAECAVLSLIKKTIPDHDRPT